MIKEIDQTNCPRHSFVEFSGEDVKKIIESAKAVATRTGMGSPGYLVLK